MSIQREPDNTGEMGRQESPEAQPGSMLGPAPGEEQPWHWDVLGAALLKSSSAEGYEVPVGHHIDHELSVSSGQSR